MKEPTLEDRMVAAHKLGVLTFERYGCLEFETLIRMLIETQVFDNMAEIMAYLAGYEGAQRRAKDDGRTTH